MEGKRGRFGILASSLFAVITTAASCGAVNAMHDSFTALGGMVPMWLDADWRSGIRRRRLGPVRHAAVRYAGGIYRRADGGRTPEYLGKKIDVREMKMIALVILVTPTLVLLGTALAMMTAAGRAGMFNQDRTALAKCCTPSPRRPITTAAPSLAWARRRRSGTCCWRSAWSRPLRRHHHSGDGHRRLAGGEEKFNRPAPHPGHHDALFIGLPVGTVLLVGALTFIPALALGPLAEHFSLL